MEKKGNLLGQLAMIVDLVEGANMESKSRTIVLELLPDEFNRISEIIQSKYEKKLDLSNTNGFSIRIGTVDIMFNKSSV